MELTIDLKNYNNTDNIFKRTASRGIIYREGKYLLIRSKYGDHKFPGGGVKKGETTEAALIREVGEETGFIVIPSSIHYYGIVHELRKGDYNDILEMDSHYYICEVWDKATNRNLDEYEEEYEYTVVWITLEEALKHNKDDVNMDKCPWTKRDTTVMQHLLNYRK